MVDVVERFFQQVGLAYNDLSEGFHDATSPEQFKVCLEKSGLQDVFEASWAFREIKNNPGELKGSVTTSSGETIPLKLNFVKKAATGRYSVFS